ncbi:unnamed protein product [Rotaria sp. Silwood2]|nr:unnamed protein product [Rotaria sp. Silwood2]
MCHSPHDNTTHFALIKQLFDIIFTSNKIIYIWGTKNELFSFVNFKLFSHEQLHSITPINLQHQFQLFWNEQHQHRYRISTSSNVFEDNCICEECIGRKPSEPWSLQDSTAYLLNEYLPKTLTRGKFNIGLDPNLFDLDFKEKQYRQQLTTYALNDCLSMQRILIYMKNAKFEFKFHSNKHSKRKLLQLSPISSNDVDDLLHPLHTSSLSKPQATFFNRIICSNKSSTLSIITLENNFTLSTQNNSTMSHPPESIPSLVGLQRYPHDWESLRTNKNDTNLPDWTNLHSTSNRDNQTNQKILVKNYLLINVEKYTIDRVRLNNQIKMILRKQQIPFCVINTTTTTTNKRKLFVAIRNPALINIYEPQSRHLFTKTHYEELKLHGQLPRANRHSNSHQKQSQARS